VSILILRILAISAGLRGISTFKEILWSPGARGNNGRP
jgi:hypothetical protein